MATKWILKRQNNNADNVHIAPLVNGDINTPNYSTGMYLEPGGELVLPGKGIRVSDEINNLKTSVSNGKSGIASAISEKGVPASGSDEFGVLAAKIRQIPVSVGGEMILSKTLTPSDNIAFSFPAGTKLAKSEVNQGYFSQGVSIYLGWTGGMPFIQNSIGQKLNLINPVANAVQLIQIYYIKADRKLYFHGQSSPSTGGNSENWSDFSTGFNIPEYFNLDLSWLVGVDFPAGSSGGASVYGAFYYF